jgi:hypothetical protein
MNSHKIMHYFRTDPHIREVSDYSSSEPACGQKCDEFITDSTTCHADSNSSNLCNSILSVICEQERRNESVSNKKIVIMLNNAEKKKGIWKRRKRSQEYE